MDRLLSAVGPVDRSKSTRARACIWAGSTPACVLELACEVAVPCIQKEAFVPRMCTRKTWPVWFVGSCAAFALPFESVHTPRDGDLAHGSPAGAFTLDRSVSQKTGWLWTGPSRQRPVDGPVRPGRDRRADRLIRAETGQKDRRSWDVASFADAGSVVAQ